MRADKMPLPKKKEPVSNKSFGALSEFAKPELISKEEGAFEQAMIEKHANKEHSF